MHETQFHPGNNLLLVAAKSQGVFDLVATKKVVSTVFNPEPRCVDLNLHRLGSTAMVLVVVNPLALIGSLLSSRLVFVRLCATSETVRGVAGSLLDLVLGGLGRVRSDLLLGLW